MARGRSVGHATPIVGWFDPALVGRRLASLGVEAMGFWVLGERQPLFDDVGFWRLEGQASRARGTSHVGRVGIWGHLLLQAIGFGHRVSCHDGVVPRAPIAHPSCELAVSRSVCPGADSPAYVSIRA